MPDNKKNNEDQERQIRLIHTLASRLPWVAVIAVFLAALVTIIQVMVTSQ